MKIVEDSDVCFNCVFPPFFITFPQLSNKSFDKDARNSSDHKNVNYLHLK